MAETRKGMASKPRTRELKSLVNQGQRMRNWLYNVVQEKWVPEIYREEMKMLVESWDALRYGDKSLLRTNEVRRG